MKKAFRNLLRNYFNFTKGERNAFFVLFVVTLLIAVYPMIGFRSRHAEQTDFSLIENLAKAAKADSAKSHRLDFEGNQKVSPAGKVYSQKFLFNPNTASFAELQSLGFEKYLAERLIKYRNSGGKFFIKTDINRIYGISQVFASELMPYIDLPDSRNTGFIKGNKEIHISVPGKPQLTDINTADTFTLNKLKGIGNKLSMRIVQFREKLGGFYSINQLKEVYGLKPEVIEEISPELKQDLVPYRLMNINEVSLEELSGHPYFKKKLAAIIINYRTQHGKFNSVDELLNIKVLDESELNKVRNYLKI